MTAQEPFHDFVRGPRSLPILLERLHPLPDDVELLLRHGRVVLVRVGVVRDGPGLAHGIRLRLWAGLGKGRRRGRLTAGESQEQFENSNAQTPGRTDYD